MLSWGFALHTHLGAVLQDTHQYELPRVKVPDRSVDVLEMPREAAQPLWEGRAALAQLSSVPCVSPRVLGCRAASSEPEELPRAAGEHPAAGTDLSARPGTLAELAHVVDSCGF